MWSILLCPINNDRKSWESDIWHLNIDLLINALDVCIIDKLNMHACLKIECTVQNTILGLRSPQNDISDFPFTIDGWKWFMLNSDLP